MNFAVFTGACDALIAGGDTFFPLPYRSTTSLVSLVSRSRFFVDWMESQGTPEKLRVQDL